MPESAAPCDGYFADVQITEATLADAAEMVEVMHEALSAHPLLVACGAPAKETIDSVADAVSGAGGLICRVGGACTGAVIFGSAEQSFSLRRVSVAPRFRNRAIASALVSAAEDVASRRGYDDVLALTVAELPSTVEFWRRHGYAVVAREDSHLTVGRALPVQLSASDTAATRAVGRRLAGVLRAGDVVILSGELGAGKTTFTQGVGAGLDVRGDVTSPTFVISRVHPSLAGGPPLVHVDAYRLNGTVDLDDLDLDTTTETAVTVVEWGEGFAEALADDRLLVRLERSRGSAVSSGEESDVYSEESSNETRTISVEPVGARWVGTSFGSRLRSHGDVAR